MKTGPTGILVIALLTLIILNNMYNNQTNAPNTQFEGFGVNGTIKSIDGTGLPDQPDQYIFTLDEYSIKKRDKQSDVYVMILQIIDVIKQFNDKLKTFIITYVSNKELENMNKKLTINENMISFLSTILPDLFNCIIKIIDSYKSKKTDNTITFKTLNYFETYFQKTNAYLQTVLTSLLSKRVNPSLYTEGQTTNLEDKTEPSIIQFMIKCDSESGILNLFKSIFEGMHNTATMEFKICNSIHYAVNKCYNLTIKIDMKNDDNNSYELKEIQTDKQIEGMQTGTLANQLANRYPNEAGEVSNIIAMNPVPTDPLVGKIVAIVVIGTTAIIIALYYFILRRETKKISKDLPEGEDAQKLAMDNMTKYINLPNMWSGIKDRLPKSETMSNVFSSITAKMGSMSNSAAFGVSATTIVMGGLAALIIFLYIKYGGSDQDFKKFKKDVDYGLNDQLAGNVNKEFGGGGSVDDAFNKDLKGNVNKEFGGGGSVDNAFNKELKGNVDKEFNDNGKVNDMFNNELAGNVDKEFDKGGGGFMDKGWNNEFVGRGLNDELAGNLKKEFTNGGLMDKGWNDEFAGNLNKEFDKGGGGFMDKGFNDEFAGNLNKEFTNDGLMDKGWNDEIAKNSYGRI